MSNENLPLGHCLSSRQRRVLQAFFDTTFASSNPSDVTPTQVDLAGRFSHWLSMGEKLPVIGFKAALWLLNWFGPLLFAGRPRRFVALSPELRTRVVSRWLNVKLYPMRMLLFGMYLMGSIIYFDLDEVKRDLGTDQRCLLDVIEEGAR